MDLHETSLMFSSRLETCSKSNDPELAIGKHSLVIFILNFGVDTVPGKTAGLGTRGSR